MSFTFDLNYDPAAQGFGAAMLRLKADLVAAGWTVEQSGDGTGGNYSAVGDVVTVSNVGVDGTANAITNRRAWFRIKAPTGTNEFIFQHDNFNVGADEYIIRRSPTAFSGSGDGAPSALIAPTSPDEFIILGPQRLPTSTGTTWAGTLGTGAQKWDFCIGNAAENYAFYGLGRSSPGGIYLGGVIFDALVNPDGADLDPYIAMCVGQHGGASWFASNSRINDQRTNTQLQASASTAIASQYAWGYERGPAADDRVFAHAMARFCYDSVVQNPWNVGGGNPYDASYDIMEPCWWYTTNLGGGTPVMSPRGLIKGESRLIKGQGSTAGANPMDTNVALTRIFQNGGYWLLWDGVTTPVL